ncbi:MAG: HAMP domain-containing histidine kinase [Lachnospiraceae bacterium]|nr:HAMP domain-containing histidine kinase [Lachnospiraceae bacterium]MCI9676349.1 HAMP domain-containing histidine kinase [Lachnospiraceae bacterium]
MEIGKCKQIKHILILSAAALILTGVLWEYIPSAGIRVILPVSGALILLLVLLWDRIIRRQQADFANDICETVDDLMAGRVPEKYRPYEDSSLSKVQGKLLQYYDRLREGQWQSEQDKQTIQELVSDISHQVKTPVANLRMFTGILKQHRLTEEKQAEFLETISLQVDKLDFLMQSLIKMSRLETGTFTLHMKQNSLYNTIAQAVNGIWAKAEEKSISIEVCCDIDTTVRHDPKWTAEALGNLLDNGIKYTPKGGSIQISVRPWQFYTRIDVSDTGMGIAPEHYNDVFKRFYRAEEAAGEEGVGLGLYLTRSIITRQKGYISVKSEAGKGTVFSVFLLAE